MIRPLRLLLVPIAVLALTLALAASTARAGYLGTYAAAASPTSILVQWHWTEDPAYPTGHLEWVGYDVYRRPLATCGDWVRVNADVIARIPGVNQDASFLDTTPASATTYQYQVRMVDSARQQLIFLAPTCMWPCSPPAYAMCPALSAPVLVGTVEEWGWGVHIVSCGTECPANGYVDNPMADVLRPYVGTGQAVAIFGISGCGMIEGCAIVLDHFTLTDCGSTPGVRRTWGALKSIYR